MFPSRTSVADTAHSSQNSVEGFHSAAMQLPLGERGAPGSASAGAKLDEAPSLPGLDAGMGESTEVMTSPANAPAAQSEEASRGGTIDAKVGSADPLSPPEAAVPVAANSKSAQTDAKPSTAAPSLPPFFKEAPASKGAATGVQPIAGALDDVNTAEVVDNSQICGVGFVDESDTAPGCKCIIM